MPHVDTVQREGSLVRLIPKPDKESYASAKSWRPIALLASLGKVFERFLANCLKKVAIDNLLLPASQYGAPGNSATECIKTLMKIIHRNWSRKKARLAAGKLQKITKMGLDIAGAFDRVNRALVLQVLADKGLPVGFLRMMQSFLSDRYTTLKLHGSTSGPTRVNIGIPQGSPLSPLLFLSITAPLLERLEAEKIHDVKIIPFCYVDDTYIVITGTEFSPQKYSITHFKNPKDKSPDCQLLPNIPGVAGNLSCFKEQKVKMLGVTLDPQLGFKSHVDDIEKRVKKKLRHLRFIARRKVGLTVHRAREFYMGSILPIFAYGCEAWFQFCPGEKLPQSLKEQVNRLESIQYDALKVVTAYFGRSPKPVILKEFYIPSIDIYLYRRAQTARTLSMNIRDQKPYVNPLHDPHSSQRHYNRLTADILDTKARKLAIRAAEALLSKKGGDEDKFLKAWRDRKKRKQAINDVAREDEERSSSQEWNKYRCERADKHPSRHRPASLREDWGHESLDLYQGLRRGESTLLLELRTEKIALNGPLHDMRILRPVNPTSEGSDHAGERAILSPACTCGHRYQTVYHLFFHCPELYNARQKLVDRIGRLDWDTLLTVHAELATQWAMAHFPLGFQYDYIREDSPFYDRHTSA
ncbi:hypothetical protein FAUST_10006 [Fusarium austroamericanum]|uniref:Reverse transcriptase domain-containing protein n=1 Tax=Fusarium austroamericanum TaxID=282268 RepID=A0AAN6BWG9_FUSAU|nr:hypothetical protein FAUST_10006 [Fusarium austroamericanum]